MSAASTTRSAGRATAGPGLDEFCRAFDEFVRAAKSARARGMGDDSLTPAQYDLLRPLLEAGGKPSLRELARAAAVSAPTAKRMVDGLEARGLITRTPCTSDRRAVRLALTGEGEAAVRRSRERLRGRQRALYERLGPDERDAAAIVLRKMAGAYDELYR